MAILTTMDERKFDLGPTSDVAIRIVTAFPGRRVNYEPVILPDKPTEDETPYRSRFYVTAANSADGHAYARGEPIPLVEAERQGLLDGEAEPLNVAAVAEGIVRPIRVHIATEERRRDGWTRVAGACAKCDGTGRRSPKTTKSHKPDCRCVGCKPCKSCDGTGKES